jgi:hypothetical protein
MRLDCRSLKQMLPGSPSAKPWRWHQHLWLLCPSAASSLGLFPPGLLKAKLMARNYWRRSW